MANSLITPTMIAKEALFQLRNNLVMGGLVHRDYKKEFVKVGDTVSIRKPVKFVASDGATRVNQDVTEANTSIVINKQKHVSWKFSMKDLTLTIEEYSKRYIEPAGIALANVVDSDLCALYNELFLKAGTAGTTPAAFADLGAVGQKMDEMAIPVDGRKIVMNPAAHWSLADALKGVFHQGMAGEIVKKGFLGEIAGFDLFRDQNIKSHVVGVPGGTPVVNTSTGITHGSANVAVTGMTATTGTYKKGDIITIAGVNAVQPLNKEDLGYLMTFVVTADVTADGSGNATLVVSPTIYTSGAHQNVVVSGAGAGKTVTLTAAHKANLGFHKNAFALVMCDLELPDGAAWKAQESHEDLSITVVKDFDIDAYEDIIRLDILYGVKCIYNDLGVRFLG